MKYSSLKAIGYSIIINLVFLTFIQAQYYYSGKTYGSEAMFNPINVILNNGYDIIQLGNKPRTIFDFPYSHAT